MLSSNQLYVAGSQDVGALPGSQVIDNFRGCMKKVGFWEIREWSLITGRGATKREGGGKRSFTPTKRGAQQVSG